jgi:hypothetical protein
MAAEILRWTSGEGCARTMLQAATKTAKELARDENIIIRRQKIANATERSLMHKYATLGIASRDDESTLKYHVEKAFDNLFRGWCSAGGACR